MVTRARRARPRDFRLRWPLDSGRVFVAIVSPPKGPMTPAFPPRLVLIAGVLAALLALGVLVGGCRAPGVAGAPRRYLVITHSALDRVSFFDLDRRQVVGVLPTQKLPHDILVTPDERTLDVVNSGGQCISVYALDAPELWRTARAFMVRDTARAGRGPRRPPSPASRVLPGTIEHHRLTEPEFPERARVAHTRAGALSHQTCTDCHDRSVGGKPFAPVFEDGARTIRLVHLAARTITWLDAATLAVKRQLPLPIPSNYSPVESWIKPGTDTAFVTCRDSIGKGLPGILVIVNLATGQRVKVLVPGIFPWHMLPCAGGTRLIVNNFQSSRLAIVDVARQAIVDSLVVENGPAAMLLVDGGRTLLVSCFYTHRVLVVDLATHAVRRRIAVGSNPTSLLACGDGVHVWVLCGGESDLERIDIGSGRVVERHPLLFGAYAMQLVPRTGSPS